MSGMLSTVAVTSRTAYMRLSAGTVCSVCPATAPPTRPICAANSSAVSPTRKPLKLSSLSSVPPVCPSPLPEYFAHFMPRLHRTGTSTSVVESDTPPVECLSAMTPVTGGRAGRSPLAAIASVRTKHSSSVMPFKSTAMQKAAICASDADPSATARTKKRSCASVSSSLRFFASITS